VAGISHFAMIRNVLTIFAGIWAMDVADAYPSASVIGVDIAAIQPDWYA
jgi:hypothetical protein